MTSLICVLQPFVDESNAFNLLKKEVMNLEDIHQLKSIRDLITALQSNDEDKIVKPFIAVINDMRPYQDATGPMCTAYSSWLRAHDVATSKKYRLILGNMKVK